MVEGWHKRHSYELSKIRTLAYPMYNWGEKNPPKITEWMPLPLIDKEANKSTGITRAEAKKIFDEFNKNPGEWT